MNTFENVLDDAVLRISNRIQNAEEEANLQAHGGNEWGEAIWNARKTAFQDALRDIERARNYDES